LSQRPLDLAGCPFDVGEPLLSPAECSLTDFAEDLARAGERRRDAQLVDEAVYDLLRAIAADRISPRTRG
jgi:hypothetical protein